jgi:hypothetical protein
MHMIKKGQVKNFGKIPLSTAQQFYSHISYAMHNNRAHSSSAPYCDKTQFREVKGMTPMEFHRRLGMLD